MQTEVVQIDVAKPDVSEIRRAAGMVDAGGLVAFPTETVYGIACRVRSDSLIRLDELKGRGPEKPYTLHISRKSDLSKYVPTVGMRAQKLTDNAWPGPLTVILELDAQDVAKLRNSLEKEVFEGLYKNNSVGVRCPDHPVASMLLAATRNAVVAPSANITGEPPAVDAEGVLDQFSDRIELLLDAGRCKHGRSSTVVKMGGKGLEVLREGVYGQAELEAMSQVKFLLVCTGNTCRSAMAEGMFRKYLAEKLGCEVDGLDKAGYKISSAGVINAAGFPATEEAVAACAARGIDIRGHASRRLSAEVVRDSDFIYAMCRMHGEHILGLSRDAASKCALLTGDRDIPDPIGQPQEVYNSCADLIEEAVKKRISELVV